MSLETRDGRLVLNVEKLEELFSRLVCAATSGLPDRIHLHAVPVCGGAACCARDVRLSVAAGSMVLHFGGWKRLERRR